jgi:aminoglycoside 2''-phosphotransferase
VDKQEAYLQTISETYPHLPIRKASLQQGGQYNDILILNDEIIFRFPKYSEGMRSLQDEVRILRRIKPYITLPTPDPIYASQVGGRPGKTFVGYPILAGEPLWRATLQSIGDESVLQRLATQLAGFLKELHRLPLENTDQDLPVPDMAAEMAVLYTEIRAHLFCYMRPQARDGVSELFEGYLKQRQLHAHPLVLKHGDFGPSNILYDRETQKISGIIDFGSAGPGDPAQDIAAVSTYGEAFLERFYPAYPEIETMLERARFYRGTFALSEALHGIKNDDQAAFKAGIASYI